MLVWLKSKVISRTGVNKLNVTMCFPFVYLSNKLKPKSISYKYTSGEKSLLKELFKFHIDDHKKGGYYDTDSMASFMSKTIQKLHPERVHWSLVKSWDRFRSIPSLDYDLQRISKETGTSIDSLVHFIWSPTNKKDMVHPKIACMFATWLDPLFGKYFCEALDMEYDKSYEESYIDAIQNKLHEISDTNKRLDHLLQNPVVSVNPTIKSVHKYV